MLSIRISEKTLKFDNIRLNKKEFHKSKQPINLDLANVDQIVVPDKFKHSDDDFKYFIGYREGKIVKLLCIILPQMSGYIKYFENGGKNVSFIIKNDMCLDKYNETWDKIIKEALNIKFHSMIVYDEKYIKAKVRDLNGVTKTNFLGDEIPEDGVHYACIACIIIDSVMRMKKMNYPQVYLEECKYKIKKIKMSNFINTELKSEPESELESDAVLESIIIIFLLTIMLMPYPEVFWEGRFFDECCEEKNCIAAGGSGMGEAL